MDTLLEFLDGNPDLLNLNSFIRGIRPFIQTERSDYCAFLNAPVFTTRTTIMEDGNVHLCYGDPIGNIFQQSFSNIFSSQTYLDRLNEYKQCPGCWTTCYTQRYLLMHPRSMKELIHNYQYWIDHHDEGVPSDAAFIGLVSCTNISVKDLEIRNNFQGIVGVDISNCTIENSNFLNNDGHGIFFVSSKDNTIKNNAFRSSFFSGIFLQSQSNSNFIYNNTFSNIQVSCIWSGVGW